MKILQTLGSTITRTVEQLVEKNHRAAMVNRIRLVIKNESESSTRLYEELGRYYFDHLRDTENKDTERLCKGIEEHEARIHRAFGKMAEVAEEARAAKEATMGAAEDCAACDGCERYGGDCSGCVDCEDREGGEASAEPAAPVALEPPFYGARKGAEDGEAADDEL